MGVPLLLTWLRRRFGACFLPAEAVAVHDDDDSERVADNVYIDLNSLLYQAAALVTASSARFACVDDADAAVLARVCELLDDVLLRLLRPRALVYIAVDGVSPLGKVSQQRARRRRVRATPPQATAAAAAGGDGDGASALHTMDELWDSNSISVGTRFMSKTVAVLHQYAVSRTERINAQRCRVAAAAAAAATADKTTATTRAVQPLAFVIDDVLRPGEGENKIIEAIRRFRVQPDYNANTSHIICSNDTDVIVSVLALHEPRMHILRYEPPSVPTASSRTSAAAAHRVYDSSSSSSSSAMAVSQPPLVDSWRCTFFSIHLFRERLRALLLGTPVDDNNNNNNNSSSSPRAAADNGAADGAAAAVVDVTSADSVRFERSLHDVVFALLLFGNDFLPTIGGSLHEGSLEALLQLLACDFVPRGRVVVDAQTHHIDVSAARYLLARLTELRGGDVSGEEAMGGGRGGGGAGLRVYDGDGADARGGDAWGYDKRSQGGTSSNTTAAAAAAERARKDDDEDDEEEQKHKCYCYWTMLQWALQYSVGIVEHWGCYYPYSTAPSLSLLSTHCGLLSYDALVATAAARHASNSKDSNSNKSSKSGNKQYSGNAMHAADTSVTTKRAMRSRPVDAMTQMLILLPPRSAAQLLPAVLVAHYNDVAAHVQAPVEQLNFALIDAWCASLYSSLSEDDRTRFDAYRVFARDDTLPLTTTATTGNSDAIACTSMTACDVVFAAYWPESMWHAAVAEAAATMTKATTATTAASTRNRLRQQQSTTTTTAMTAAAAAAARTHATAASTFQFFAARPAQQSLRTAAAALLSSSSSPATTSHRDVATTTAAVSSASELTAAVVATPTSPQPPQLQQQQHEAGATDDDKATMSVRRLRGAHGSYVLCVAPLTLLLRDVRVARAMGVIAGGSFVVGDDAQTTSQQQQQRVPLSRDAGTQRVRLQWSLAAAPHVEAVTTPAAATSSSSSAPSSSLLLLPGVRLPVQQTYRARIAAQRRALVTPSPQQQQHVDKRPRTHDNDDDSDE